MAKQKEIKKYIVLVDFTTDRAYRRGEVYKDNNEKITKILLTNKHIK